MKILTLLFLLVYVQPIYAASSTVEIEISFEGSERNTVSYELPINNCMLTQIVNDQNKLTVGGTLMSVFFDIDSPAAIRLWLNGEKCINLIVKPNDKILIKAKRTHISKYPEYNLLFTGTGASAHTLYNKDFIPIGSKFFVIEDFAFKSKNHTDFFKTVKVHIDSISAIWQQLGDRDAYARQNYSLYEKDIRAALYKEAILKLTKVPVKNDYQNSADWLNTRQLMFHYGGVNDPELLRTHFGKALIKLYHSDLARKDPSISDTLTQQSEYNYWYYYDKSCSEAVWAHEIINTYTQTYPVLDSLQSYKEFNRWFPNSEFQSVFHKLKDSSEKILKNSKEKPFIKTELVNNFDTIFSGLKYKKTLVCYWSAEDLLSRYQIRKLDFLQQALDKLPINIIFISSDDNIKWRNGILTRKYTGYHFRISEGVEDYLLTSIGTQSGEEILSTPDFYIYDYETKKLETCLPFPEAGKYFIEHITTILN